MQKFESKEFSVPKLKGISEKTIEEHMKLYQGYVKHTNLILEHIEELAKDAERYAYELGEIQRRFSFEFNGMRNHEVYFASLEGGSKVLNEKSSLKNKIIEEFGNFDLWLNRFKSIALTRGIGWAILYWDSNSNRLLNAWVDEQHLGQLSGCTPVLALDMWEHSYVADYNPSGKKQYAEDFLENLNWEVVEENFENATS
ncbi:MAG: Fe-Mn family superoxide dismutase [Patescibacteria group bacterium]